MEHAFEVAVAAAGCFAALVVLAKKLKWSWGERAFAAAKKVFDFALKYWPKPKDGEDDETDND